MLYVLKNKVQHYDWGSGTSIPGLLDIPNNENKPFAELWMGTHPGAPSMVRTGKGFVYLPEIIKTNPGSVLGKQVAERFGDELPFLFKVLAAERSLSIQAHPDLEQAEEGFRRENEMQIPSL